MLSAAVFGRKHRIDWSRRPAALSAHVQHRYRFPEL